MWKQQYCGHSGTSTRAHDGQQTGIVTFQDRHTFHNLKSETNRFSILQANATQTVLVKQLH